MLKEFYREVTGVLQGRYRDVTWPCRVYINIAGILQASYRDGTYVLQGCYLCITGLLNKVIQGVTLQCSANSSLSQTSNLTNYSYSYSYRRWLCVSIPIPIRGENTYLLREGLKKKSVYK